MVFTGIHQLLASFPLDQSKYTRRMFKHKFRGNIFYDFPQRVHILFYQKPRRGG